MSLRLWFHVSGARRGCGSVAQKLTLILTLALSHCATLAQLQRSSIMDSDPGDRDLCFHTNGILELSLQVAVWKSQLVERVTRRPSTRKADGMHITETIDIMKMHKAQMRTALDIKEEKQYMQ